MPVGTKGPTTEIGSASQTGVNYMAWGTFIDSSEVAAELTWPNSMRLYSKMRTDAQIEGLFLGCTLPIRNYEWVLEPNGAKSEVLEALSSDLQIPIRGREPQPLKRRKDRFSFDEHLYHVLLSLLYGHMYFEQVGEVRDDGLWHLKKLGPRLPETIQEINIAADGGLNYIKQIGASNTTDIPVNKLVAYVWEKEGANWIGRSMLRRLYKHWLIKDRLLRVDAINHERAGAGVPTIEAPMDATPAQIERLALMAEQFKAGEEAGGALPHGAKLTLNGVQGSQPRTLESIRYHDEQMARSWMMMFIQLGQTETGSRALGDSFIDFFQLSQESIAKWVADVFSQHVIEDWVDWNFGEEEQAPILTYVKDSNEELATSDLATLVEKGVVTVDPELEAVIRKRYNLPEKPEEEAQTTPVPPPTPTPPQGTPEETLPGPVAKRHKSRAVEVNAATSSVALPDRPLRRQPYEHEVLAATDFAQLDKQWEEATDDVVSKVEKNQKKMIGELHKSIEDADGDLVELASLQVAGKNTDVIYDHMQQLTEEGAATAIAEAGRQGRKIEMPDLEDVNTLLKARASAVDKLLARSLSEAAGRKALALTGGALSPKEVADSVKAHLESLKNTYLKEQLGGAMQAAQNSGRKKVFQTDPPKQLYSSELLDSNTCENCAEVDGTQYDDISAAEADYPTGGFMDCLGGVRCRGTLVAVYDEASPSNA